MIRRDTFVNKIRELGYTLNQRKACYEDPAYEARQRIADRVICRRASTD